MEANLKDNFLMKIEYSAIGTIHSPFKTPHGMPIQPSAAIGIKGTINLHEKFIPALSDLDGFSHIYILYHFHLAAPQKLKVIPFLDVEERGIFSTRAPIRPNTIGLSVLKLVSIKENILSIENVDVVDGTPLLDIKPYIQDMEAAENVRIGWLEKFKNNVYSKNADDRFS